MWALSLIKQSWSCLLSWNRSEVRAMEKSVAWLPSAVCTELHKLVFLFFWLLWRVEVRRAAASCYWAPARRRREGNCVITAPGRRAVDTWRAECITPDLPYAGCGRRAGAGHGE